MIPYGRQEISEQDIQSVADVLRSDWLTQGPHIEGFERAISGACNGGYAVAVCNATAALHISCLALELGPGDFLWTSPNTFVASANCALYCGANVDFVDIDPRTYNMSVAALREKLVEAEKFGRLPKVVVPVDFAGQSCEMREIKALAGIYGFKILEDASHAIGGKYLGKPTGAGDYADITVFSFHPVKIITTGEGGVAVTNDEQLAARLRLLRSHGITREFAAVDAVPWSYRQVMLGFNYRITDIQAALGISQLARLDEFIGRRHMVARRYHKALENICVLPYQHPDTFSAYHLYPIKVPEEVRKQVFEYLREAGIQVNVHYIPVHTQPYYLTLGFHVGDFPESEKYYRETISLPMYPALTNQQQDYVIEKVVEAIQC